MDRSLTPGQLAYWERRFAAADYAIVIEDRATLNGLSISGEMYGVKVTHADGSRYDYRFREGESADDLLERILVERAAEAKRAMDLHQSRLDAATAHYDKIRSAKG